MNDLTTNPSGAKLPRKLEGCGPAITAQRKFTVRLNKKFTVSGETETMPKNSSKKANSNLDQRDFILFATAYGQTSAAAKEARKDAGSCAKSMFEAHALWLTDNEGGSWEGFFASVSPAIEQTPDQKSRKLLPIYNGLVYLKERTQRKEARDILQAQQAGVSVNEAQTMDADELRGMVKDNREESFADVISTFGTTRDHFKAILDATGYASTKDLSKEVPSKALQMFDAALKIANMQREARHA